MSSEGVQNLDKLLARKRELLSLGSATPEIEARLRELRGWQAARLVRTYTDLRGNARYAPALEFFVTDLYGAHGFAARDRDLIRAWRYLRRSLPEAPLRALGGAIELEVLSAELDHAMVAVLAPGAIDEALYAKAYRAVGQRDARERQIQLAVGAGKDLEGAVRHAWIGALLRAAHRPAHLAGFGVLQDFIERGYEAFRNMGDAQPLLDAIRQRETALMDALFSNAPDPFARAVAKAPV